MRGALRSARWLKNHGLSLGFNNGRGRLAWRFVRPGTAVTVAEAARALRTNEMRLYRLNARGKLVLLSGGAGTAQRVPWRELVRLKRDGLAA